MLSSLQALNAAGAAPASRSAAFQPKVKPRARKAAAAEENIASTQESAAVPAPVAQTPAPAVVIPTPPVVSAPSSCTPPPTPGSRVETRGTFSPRSIPPALPSRTPSQVPATRVENSAPSSSAGPSSSQRPPASSPSLSTGVGRASSTVEPADSSKVKRKRVATSPTRRRRRVDVSFEEDVDLSTMKMKEIIRFVEAKDRQKQKEEAAKKQEQRSSVSESAQQEREQEQPVPLAPQVEIVDGKIVINQRSLAVDAGALNRDDVGSYRRIEESSSKLNYHSYLKKIPRERWKREETEKFYRSVQQFGTDFAVIKHLFPGKTRQQIKAKFKKEERENPRRLMATILEPRQNLNHYEELVNQLRASAAAKAAAEDEFDFTWDLNTNKGSHEGVEQEANEELDNMAEAGEDIDNYEEEEEFVAEGAKTEEGAKAEEEQQQQESKVEYAAQTPPPPALFAYETELPFAFS